MYNVYNKHTENRFYTREKGPHRKKKHKQNKMNQQQHIMA